MITVKDGLSRRIVNGDVVETEQRVETSLVTIADGVASIRIHIGGRIGGYQCTVVITASECCQLLSDILKDWQVVEA